MKTTAETTQNEATAAAVAEQGATTEPKQASAKTRANKKKGAPKAKKGAKKSAAKKEAKPAGKPTAKKEAKPASKKAANVKEAKVPREFSKKAIVLDLLRRKDGATLAQIAEATAWQTHSIRGFISTVTKKMDLPIVSLKNAAGDRFYRIEK
jgi:hypothetical protein